MLNLLFTAIVLAIPVYMLVVTVHGFLAAPGTTWERLVEAFRGSASIFWARLNGLSVAAIGLLGEVAPLIGAPGIKDELQRWLTPDAIGIYMLVVLIGAEIARRRTLA